MIDINSKYNKELQEQLSDHIETYTKSYHTRRYSNSFMMIFICILCNKDNSKNDNNDNKIGISTLCILNNSLIFVNYSELFCLSFENLYRNNIVCFYFLTLFYTFEIILIEGDCHFLYIRLNRARTNISNFLYSLFC
jgi:hypothetical protein